MATLKRETRVQIALEMSGKMGGNPSCIVQRQLTLTSLAGKGGE